MPTRTHKITFIIIASILFALAAGYTIYIKSLNLIDTPTPKPPTNFPTIGQDQNTDIRAKNHLIIQGGAWSNDIHANLPAQISKKFPIAEGQNLKLGDDDKKLTLAITSINPSEVKLSFNSNKNLTEEEDSTICYVDDSQTQYKKTFNFLNDKSYTVSSCGKQSGWSYAIEYVKALPASEIVDCTKYDFGTCPNQCNINCKPSSCGNGVCTTDCSIEKSTCENPK